MPTYTINVSVTNAQDPAGNNYTFLSYDGRKVQGVGKPNGRPKSFTVAKGCGVEFQSTDGDLVVQFKTPNAAPFKNQPSSERITVATRAGVPTNPLTVKSQADLPVSVFVNYTVVLLPSAGGDPIIDDPELEAGGDTT